MFNAIFNWIKYRKSVHLMEKKGQIGTRKRRTDNQIIAASEDSQILPIFMALLLWAVCTLILTLPALRPLKFSLVENQNAPRTVFAAFDYSYVDTAKTAKLKEQARSQAPVYYDISDISNNNVIQSLNNAFAAIGNRTIAESQNVPYVSDNTQISNLISNLNSNTVKTLYAIAQDENQLKEFYRQLEIILSSGIINSTELQKYKIGQQIKIIDSLGRERQGRLIDEISTVEKAAETFTDRIMKNYSPGGDRNIFRQNLSLLATMILEGGNLRYNVKQSDQAQVEASNSIEPVMVGVRKNDPIVNYNQKINREILDSISTYELLYAEKIQTTNTVRTLVNNAIWSLILVAFVSLYMYHIHPEVIKDNRKMALAGTVVLLSLLLDFVCSESFYFFSSSFEIPPIFIMNAIPIALPAVLLAVMLGFRVALYVGFFVSAVMAMALGSSFDVALEGLVVCAVTAIVVRSSNNYRAYFIRSMLSITLVVLVLDFNFFWEVPEHPRMVFWTIGFSLFNGVLTAVLALVLLFVFELVFNVSTNMSLMVLCDYNHPLLKELQLRAPGTSHHCQNVATMAEIAAKEVNANPTQARVGALYHDIGKLSKPEYFTENNIENNNLHTKLHPQISSLIIMSHVKEGLDLAHKYKLCRIVRDTIQQHHGTDLLQFFYQRALNEPHGSPVTEAQYRYSGPLPHRKEIVIVSLADACEAACRSLDKPTSSKIEAMVSEIFRKRMRDGQLNDADLTVADLSKIRESFIRTLTTMHHGRIAYPRDENQDNESDLFMESAKVAGAEPKSTKESN